MRKAHYKYELLDSVNSVVCGAFGCYTSFTLMNNIRRSEKLKDSFLWIILSAVSLMFFSVWPLHLLAVFSMIFTDFELYYRIDYTMFSLLAGAISAVIGFSIAFIPIILETRKLYKTRYPNHEITYFEFVQKSHHFKKKYIAYIAIGGIFTGPGIMSLHIIGMFSMFFPGEMDFHWDIQIIIIVSGIFVAYIIYFGFYFAHIIKFKIFLSMLVATGVAIIHYSSVHFTEFYYDPNTSIDLNSYRIIGMSKLGRIIVIMTYSSANILKEISHFWNRNNISFISNLEKVIKKNKNSVGYLSRVVRNTIQSLSGQDAETKELKKISINSLGNKPPIKTKSRFENAKVNCYFDKKDVGKQENSRNFEDISSIKFN